MCSRASTVEPAAAAPAGDLGEADDLAVMARLIPLAGRTLVDVGAGDGRLARGLAARGARVIAVEPGLADGTPAKPAAGVAALAAAAEALPLAEACADGVVFAYSLHHVPRELRAEAIAEALRVLAPDHGFLYVIEPLPTGTYYALMRDFHDEARAWAETYDTLKAVARGRFASETEATYTDWATYSDYDAFLAEWASRSYLDLDPTHLDTASVRARFAAGRADDGYRFSCPARLNLYRNLIAAA